MHFTLIWCKHPVHIKFFPFKTINFKNSEHHDPLISIIHQSSIHSSVRSMKKFSILIETIQVLRKCVKIRIE